MSRRSIVGTGLAAFFFAAAAAVAQSPLDAMRACTAEKSESVRLACYDRAMAMLNPPQVQPHSPPQPVAQPQPPEPVPPPVAAQPQPVSPPPVTAQPLPQPGSPPVAAPAAEEFGMTEELRRKRNPEQAKADVSQELRARVVSVARPQGKSLRVELENGQVWVENERKDGLNIREGDLVTIKSGLLGSYFLSMDSGVATRVRRVR
jgi:hypothetical protein